MNDDDYREKDESLHNIARTAVSVVRARWDGDHEGAWRVVNSMTTAELHATVWSVSGLIEFALRAPSALSTDTFLDMLLDGITQSETDQAGDNHA